MTQLIYPYDVSVCVGLAYTMSTLCERVTQVDRQVYHYISVRKKRVVVEEVNETREIEKEPPPLICVMKLRIIRVKFNGYKNGLK
jgi:hypothetical protein